MYHPRYVPVTISQPHTPVSVPPLIYTSPEAEASGKRRYETQKKVRASRRVESALDDEFSAPGQINIVSSSSRDLSNVHSVSYSQSSLIVMLHPSECNMFGVASVASGGSIMKMMDTLAGKITLCRLFCCFWIAMLVFIFCF